MRTVTSSYQGHVDGETTAVATLWSITRRDGVEFHFTGHTSDISVGGTEYKALSGETPTNIESSADLAVDNVDIIARLDSEDFTEEELVAGLFDYATIQVEEFSYADPSLGTMILRAGTLGEHAVDRGKVRVELRGVMQPLQQTRGRIFQKRCDADVYDARCQANTATFLQSGTVIASTNRYTLTASGLGAANDWFNNAKLCFTTGANSGICREVKRSTIATSITTLQFHFALPFTIAAGDTFVVPAGCNLTRTDCLSKFNNVANFRGAPDLPTRDAVLAYPDSPA